MVLAVNGLSSAVVLFYTVLFPAQAKHTPFCRASSELAHVITSHYNPQKHAQSCFNPEISACLPPGGPLQQDSSVKPLETACLYIAFSALIQGHDEQPQLNNFPHFLINNVYFNWSPACSLACNYWPMAWTHCSTRSIQPYPPQPAVTQGLCGFVGPTPDQTAALRSASW